MLLLVRKLIIFDTHIYMSFFVTLGILYLYAAERLKYDKQGYMILLITKNLVLCVVCIKIMIMDM